jgi:hypothetical protein
MQLLKRHSINGKEAMRCLKKDNSENVASANNRIMVFGHFLSIDS